jgi:hypothetical protein
VAGHRPQGGRPTHSAGLTEREIDVLPLIARGRTNTGGVVGLIALPPKIERIFVLGGLQMLLAAR